MRPGTMQTFVASTVALACLVLIGGFAYVSHVFGFGSAVVLSLLFAPTLVISVRIFRRRPAVRAREVCFVAVLFCVTVAGTAFVVHKLFETGMDQRHAEDLQWAKFERLLRQEPSFRDVQINLTDRKHIYWASGTVDSDDDLNRLRSLAALCGIERRLDGPYEYGISLTVKSPTFK